MMSRIMELIDDGLVAVERSRNFGSELNRCMQQEGFAHSCDSANPIHVKVKLHLAKALVGLLLSSESARGAIRYLCLSYGGCTIPGIFVDATDMLSADGNSHRSTQEKKKQ